METSPEDDDLIGAPSHDWGDPERDPFIAYDRARVMAFRHELVFLGALMMVAAGCVFWAWLRLRWTLSLLQGDDLDNAEFALQVLGAAGVGWGLFGLGCLCKQFWAPIGAALLAYFALVNYFTSDPSPSPDPPGFEHARQLAFALIGLVLVLSHHLLFVGWRLYKDGIPPNVSPESLERGRLLLRRVSRPFP